MGRKKEIRNFKTLNKFINKRNKYIRAVEWQTQAIQEEERVHFEPTKVLSRLFMGNHIWFTRPKSVLNWLFPIFFSISIIYSGFT